MSEPGRPLDRPEEALPNAGWAGTAAGKQIAFINVFRAGAAYWVLCAHCMIWGGWFWLPLPPAKSAVDLFMMISGYLMAANASARSRVEPLSLRTNRYRFWLRRFFRLSPVYYLALALAAVAGTHFLGGYRELQALDPGRWTAGGVYDPARIEYTPGNLLLHATYLFGLHPRTTFSTFLPDWSLSLEMQFYLVFPPLIVAMHRIGHLRSALGIGVPVFLLGAGMARWVDFPEPSLLPFKFHYFLAGILGHRFVETERPGPRALALALTAILLVTVDVPYRGQSPVVPGLLVAMLYLGRLETAGRTPGWLAWTLDNRLVRFGSDTSYGVYLFHGFFLSLAGLMISRTPGLLALAPRERVLFLCLFVTGASYLSAFLVHRFVELPGIRLGRRWIDAAAPLPRDPGPGAPGGG